MAVDLKTPTSADALAEELLNEQKRNALLADPDKFRKMIKDYASHVADTDPDLQAQLKDSQEKVTADFLKKNGYRPAEPGEVEKRRLPLDDKAGKRSRNAAPGAALNGQFADFGEFLKASWHRSGGVDARLKALSEGQGSAGGFLVPEEYRAEILKLAIESAVIRPRARVVPMGRLTVRYPTIRDTSHASTIHGGVSAQWVAEGADLSSNTNQPTFGQSVLTAKKLTGYTVVSNEEIEDSAVSVEAILNQLFADALAFFEDDAFIAGVGGGQPLGILNADALISVAKETGQAADSIAWENIVKMFSRMLPSSLNRAVWYAHPDTFPALATMSLSVGTGGAPVWLGNGVGGPPMSILGRPLIFTEKAETVGDAGDLVFADLSYYLIGDRRTLTIDSSPHVQFINDRTVWRFIQRLDGRPWLDSAVTPRNGSNTMSPFVALAARA